MLHFDDNTQNNYKNYSGVYLTYKIKTRPVEFLF